MPVINRIAEFSSEMIEWRHHLHQYPELMFETKNTAAFVVEKLRSFGVTEIHEGIAKNGVVAVIEGEGEGPVIGLRADMDALPILEETGRPYASRTQGVMHACGHDGHTTTLLGAARYLAETRKFKGKAVLVFQPAEEGGGGARVMVEEGVLDRFGIEEIYALHNWPGKAEGEFHIADGAAMAAADMFNITIKGKGSHAAMPQASLDPVALASTIVTSLQQIVSRKISPFDPAVLSVTEIKAGTAYNVIPSTAHLKGTIRTLSQDTRMQVFSELRAITEGIASAFGAKAELVIHEGYPVTVNHPEGVSYAAQIAQELVGDPHVHRSVQPSMGAEDFAYFLEKRKGAYVFLGAGEGPNLHHPEFDYNDALLPIGASWFVGLVENAGR